MQPYCQLPTMGPRENQGYLVMLIPQVFSRSSSHPIPPRR